MRLVSLLVAAVTAGCATPGAVVPDGAPRGTSSLSFERHDGAGRWTPDQDRGRVVLLDAWATWCEPCRESLAQAQELQRRYADRGLVVYAVNVDADARGVGAFLGEARVTLPVLLDPEGRVVGSRLEMNLLPTAWLLDRHGRVRHVHEGLDDAARPRGEAELEALLAEPAP